MSEYERLLNEVYDYLSYPNVIYNEDIISVYDYCRILNNALLSVRCAKSLDSLKRKLNRLYPLMLRRDNKRSVGTDIVTEVTLIRGVNASKIKIVRNISGEGEYVSYICRDNDSDELYLEGDYLEEEIFNKYRKEFSLEMDRLEDINVESITFPEETFTDGVVTIKVTFDEFSGVSTLVTLNSDKNSTVDKEYLSKDSIRSILDSHNESILKKMRVVVKDLNPDAFIYVDKALGKKEVLRLIRSY